MNLPLNEERVEQLRFLTNELVTNSVRHAVGESICVEVDVLSRTVRVTIADDGGDDEPRVQRASVWNTGGRGLALVDQLSNRWGYRPGDGTEVWFEMDRDAAGTRRSQDRRSRARD